MIDPWSSEPDTNYARLMKEFGIKSFDFELPDAPALFRRGVVLGHRDFQLCHRAIERNDPWALMTGLMPSGKMHIGHKMVIEQMIYYQRFNTELFIAVADFEAFAARNISFEKGKKLAIEEYIKSYIALGLVPDNCQIYFQSRRRAVKDLGLVMGRKVNLQTMGKIYDWKPEVNLSHVNAPLVQAGDILHPQLEKYGGPRPTLVPVGIDQDPHLRLTRDLAFSHSLFSVKKMKGGGVSISLKVDPITLSFFEGADVFQMISDAVSGLGFLDINRNEKHNMVMVKAATPADQGKIARSLIPVERELGGFGFYPPSSTYHRFMTGLTGGKMSSSDPSSSIFLNEPLEENLVKIRKKTKTGGRDTLKEQKELGGEPEKCSIFELYKHHFMESDPELRDTYNRCTSGDLLCGECKDMAADLVEDWLTGYQERYDQADDVLGDYLADDEELFT